MNITKNGIFIESRPKPKAHKIMQRKPNPYKLFATLTRIEDGHVVWITMPLFEKEIERMKLQGWQQTETWEPTKQEVAE